MDLAPETITIESDEDSEVALTYSYSLPSGTRSCPNDERDQKPGSPQALQTINLYGNGTDHTARHFRDLLTFYGTDVMRLLTLFQ